MSETTGIAWADSTGNPWIGCSKVSPGCKNCYAAELDANKFSRTMGGATPTKPISHWGKGAPRVRTKAFWKDALAWERKALQAQTEYNNRHDGTLREVFKPHTLPPRPDRPRIFPSLCDWLDDEVPIQWLADFLKLIHDTPNLDWLLLTKRPENFRKRLQSVLDMETPDEDDFMKTWMVKMNGEPGWALNVAFWIGISKGMKIEPFPNVWLGVSVEDQKRADERIPQLLQIPAKVRFLSVEPLLGPVDLNKIRVDGEVCPECNDPVTTSCLSQTAHCACCVEGDEPVIFGPIRWVIGGLESGKGRRDSLNGVEDLVSLANQCVDNETPFFCKQDCAFKPGQQGRIPNEIWGLKQFPQ
jgi:protein gp37